MYVVATPLGRSYIEPIFWYHRDNQTGAGARTATVAETALSAFESPREHHQQAAGAADGRNTRPSQCQFMYRSDDRCTTLGTDACYILRKSVARLYEIYTTTSMATYRFLFSRTIPCRARRVRAAQDPTYTREHPRLRHCSKWRGRHHGAGRRSLSGEDLRDVQRGADHGETEGLRQAVQ